MLSRRTRSTTEQNPAHDRPDVFLSYSREDKEFAEGRLTKALAERGKDVWIDVEDIRGGASDWRASVWAGIEAAKVVVFVLTPDSLASKVCGEELAQADELNKRIVPVLQRSVKGLPVPPALARAQLGHGAPGGRLRGERQGAGRRDRARRAVGGAARAAHPAHGGVAAPRPGRQLPAPRQRPARRRASGSTTRPAHDEAPTADQVTYITASRRAAARRQRALLGGRRGGARGHGRAGRSSRSSSARTGDRPREDGPGAGPRGAVDRRAVA